MENITDAVCPCCEDSLSSSSAQQLYLLPCLHVLCARCAHDLDDVSVAQECPICHETMMQPRIEINASAPVFLNGQMSEEVDQCCACRYCETCQAVVCLQCSGSQANLCDQSNHKLVSTTSIIDFLESKNKTLLSQAQEIKKALVDIGKVQQAVRQRQQLLINLITSSFQTLIGQVNPPLQNEAIDLVNKRRDDLIVNATTIIQSHAKTLELQIAQLQVLMSHIEAAAFQAHLMVFALSVISHDGISRRRVPTKTVLLNYATVSQRIVTLQASVPILNPLVQDSLRFSIDMPASVHALSTLAPTSMAELENIGWLFGQSGVPSRDWKTVGDPVAIIGSIEPSREPGRFRVPSQVTITSSGLLAVTEEGNDRVQLLTVDGQHVAFLGVGQLSYPEDIAVGPDGRIWVADYQNRRLVSFHEPQGSADQTDQFSLIVDKVIAPWPMGVLILPSGEICCANYGGHCIRVHSATGVPIREFGSRGSQAGQFIDPANLALLRNGDLVIADYSNDRIQILTTAGEFVRSFDVFGPRGVAVTQDNLILVAERYRHRVSVWTADGQMVHTWGFHGYKPGQFSYPRGVCQLPDGRVVVVDSNNNRLQLF